MTSHRLRIAAFIPLAMIANGLVLRPALYTAFHEGEFSPWALGLSLGAGFVYDALVGVLLATPVTLAIAALRLKLLERRGVRLVAFTLIGTAMVYLSFVEWHFFAEFDSRFNNIAIDYLRNYSEVLGNIKESYHAGSFLAMALACGVVLALAGERWARGTAMPRLTFLRRLEQVVFALATSLVAGAALAALPSDVTDDRVVSEIAQNGVDRLIHAVRTGNLDYDVYYRTLAPSVATQRAASVLDAPWIEGKPAAARPASAPKPWDVVVILEESFGSEFIGVLGHPERRTSPGFDRWSGEGLLLTNLTATGNRTVRGLEGTLCSMVPLPSAAVLRRMKRREVATLADVFRDEGFTTAFVYGGWGRFDDMKPFLPINGFSEFIERDAYPDDAFRTIWGVADEWVFAKALDRQQEAHARGERLFMTILTVSNHRPFATPERHTAYPAAQRSRESAVAYADWALADYLDKAKASGLLDHTLLLIEGDHGARVYGSQEIPTPSYRIPGLFLVPGSQWNGRRIDRLISQIDLAPTLLALTGRASPAPFLGEDVTALPTEGGRAFVQHNRDVGLLTDRTLVTLGLHHNETCYARSGRNSDAFSRALECATSQEASSQVDDAVAVYQTADSLLRDGAYRFPWVPRMQERSFVARSSGERAIFQSFARSGSP